MKSPSKFLLSGFLNTTLSYLAFFAVLSFTESVATALLSGLGVGIITSYTLNRFWVWKVKESGSIWRFVIFQLTLVVINWLILHWVSLFYFSREVAQIFIYGILAPLAYKVNEVYIFNKRTKA